MTAISLIERYNNIFRAIGRAKTVDDIQQLETQVKAFYTDCKAVDKTGAVRIINMYADKVREMVSDNATAFGEKKVQLDKAKNWQYDFAGEKDDSAAVHTKMLQLMGQLPKTKNPANASGVRNIINRAIESGVIGSKAVLQLAASPLYADMLDDTQRMNATEGSKSNAQKAAENANNTEYQRISEEYAEVYNAGARLRRTELRMDNFQKSIQIEDEYQNNDNSSTLSSY